jgi:hypothetical protein
LCDDVVLHYYTAHTRQAQTDQLCSSVRTFRATGARKVPSSFFKKGEESLMRMERTTSHEKGLAFSGESLMRMERTTSYEKVGFFRGERTLAPIARER